MLSVMGFLDKAKAAANELAAKADSALTQASSSWAGSGEAERLLRDLGLLTWREQQGQPVDAADLARVKEGLAALERDGRLATLQVQTQPAPPPPGAQTPPPPPGGSTPPPPGGGQTPPASSGGQTPPAPSPGGTGTVPPPPPPPPGF